MRSCLSYETCSLCLSVKVTDGFCLVGVTVAWGGLCEGSFGIGVRDLKMPGKCCGGCYMYCGFIGERPGGNCYVLS